MVPNNYDILKDSSLEALISSSENLIKRIEAEAADEEKERLLSLANDLAYKISGGGVSKEEAAKSLAQLYSELEGK